MATTLAFASANTLGVTTEIKGVFRYQWMRDGEYLGGSQDKSYTIVNPKPEDLKAKYSVRVTGQDGHSETSNELVLGSYVPPAKESVAYKGPERRKAVTPRRKSILAITHPDRRLAKAERRGAIQPAAADVSKFDFGGKR